MCVLCYCYYNGKQSINWQYLFIYLNIWTPDRVNRPRFVPSIDSVNDILYKVLSAVDFVEILKATPNDNRMQMDYPIDVMLSIVAC
jgi:hypothetical protein